MLQSKGSFVVCLVALVGLIGCGGGGADVGTVQVTGTVTLDGTPVAGATVSFQPASEGARVAVGTTDNSGRFELMTVEAGDGAIPGSYKVAVTKTTGGLGPTMTATTKEEAMKDLEKIAAGRGPAAKQTTEVKEEMPAKYTSAETSGLTAEVKADDDNDFEFKLSSTE